jgi:alpha-tubulin suppressor-like RCC1 family protein
MTQQHHHHHRTMFVAGATSKGQLGKLFNTSQVAGEVYETPLRIKQIKSGGMHTMILTEDNCLYVAGHNSSGQMFMDKSYEPPNEFTKVEWNGPVIQQIDVGGYYGMILCGKLF